LGEGKILPKQACFLTEKIINALIHKVELSKEILKIHYYVGAGHVNGESNPKGLGSPSFFVPKSGVHSLNKVLAFRRSDFSKRQRVNSSQSIDVGDPDRSSGNVAKVT
jgi:hypothetical protein